MTCGRKLSGESFQFSRYHSQTEIFLSGKLIVKENLLMAPELINVNAIGQLEGYTHQATFICLGVQFPGNTVIENIHELLLNEKDICFGVSALPVDGFIVRLLGYRAEQLYNSLKVIALHVTALQKKKKSIKTPAYAK